VGGSTAATHANGASVDQNQCVLTSTGGVPTLTTPITKRVLNQILLGSAFSPGQNGSGAGTGQGAGIGAGAGVYETPFIVGSGVTLVGGASVTNSSVTKSSANFPGSTIVAGGSVIFLGSASTEVSNGSGGLTVSSSVLGLGVDVALNDSNISSATMWNDFFTQSAATVQANANQSYNSGNINGATGQTIWMNSYTTLLGSTTIGSPTSPVILIVNGNLSVLLGSLTVYGLLYITGSITSLVGSITVNGALAIQGGLGSIGNITVNYNPSILNRAAGSNSSAKTTYSIVPANTQEQFV
jgi:hypothetical protein